MVDLSIRARDGTDVMMSLLTVSLICEPLSGQNVTLASKKYPYLSKLDLADFGESGSHLNVDILIGADYYWSLVTGRTQHGSGPTAVETRLGWVLSGPATGLTLKSTSVNLLSCYVLNAGVQSCDTSLDQTLQRFWDLETLGIKAEETSIYDEFTHTIAFQGGRYCMQLPWKGHHPPLPDNYHLCQVRLFGLIRRLKKDPHILHEYDKIIRDQIKQGIVEIVKDQWNTTNKLHYLPHHCVIREDKTTTKLRIVYDASAKTNGPSLNDCLYARPSFGQKIADILIRFRSHPVALIADIERAFLMISIAEEDRDVLRFLWVENIGSELPRVQVLRFTRVVFGISSSPFLLNATIRYHMEGYKDRDPQFIEKFQRSIYVDDLTFGGDNDEEVFEREKSWLAEGAFNLRKFVTNSPQLQRRIDD